MVWGPAGSTRAPANVVMLCGSVCERMVLNLVLRMKFARMNGNRTRYHTPRGKQINDETWAAGSEARR